MPESNFCLNARAGPTQTAVGQPLYRMDSAVELTTDRFGKARRLTLGGDWREGQARSETVPTN